MLGGELRGRGCSCQRRENTQKGQVAGTVLFTKSRFTCGTCPAPCPANRKPKKKFVLIPLAVPCAGSLGADRFQPQAALFWRLKCPGSGATQGHEGLGKRLEPSLLPQKTAVGHSGSLVRSERQRRRPQIFCAKESATPAPCSSCTMILRDKSRGHTKN